MLAILLAVVLIIYTLSILGTKKSRDLMPVKSTPVNADSHILEGTYSNFIHNFRVTLPTKDWRFKLHEDTLPLQEKKKDPNRSYLAQTQSLLSLELWDRELLTAQVEIGIVPLSESRAAKTVAIESYMEIIADK